MRFDENSDQPLFQQVAQWLTDAIISGALAAEGQIPSITELAAVGRINPATALKGVNLLVAEGLIYKKRGLGMFVAADARQRLLRQRRQGFADEHLRPLLREAERLEISHQEIIDMIARYGK